MRHALALTAAITASLSALPQASLAMGAEALAEFLRQCPAEAQHPCQGLAEAKLIAQAAPGRVLRQGPRLSIRRVKGQVLSLDDQTDETGAAVRHVYLSELGVTDIHVVRTLGPGAAHPLLLVPENAQTPLAADDIPWPAPGGRLMVIAAPNSLALWQRTALRWTLAFRYEPPPGVNLSFKGWRGDGGAVHLGWTWQRQPGGCSVTGAHSGSTQLREGPFGWELTPELPLRC